jgi:uncharacterized membrane protein
MNIGKSNNLNLKGGYVGILMLLIGVAIIIFIVVRLDFATDKKNTIEDGLDAIKQAEITKKMLEDKSKQLFEE